MTDTRGTFEHADLTEPRIEIRYCTDDMARVLVVTARGTVDQAADDGRKRHHRTDRDPEKEHCSCRPRETKVEQGGAFGRWVGRSAWPQHAFNRMPLLLPSSRRRYMGPVNDADARGALTL